MRCHLISSEKTSIRAKEHNQGKLGGGSGFSWRQIISDSHILRSFSMLVQRWRFPKTRVIPILDSFLMFLTLFFADIPEGGPWEVLIYPALLSLAIHYSLLSPSSGQSLAQRKLFNSLPPYSVPKLSQLVNRGLWFLQGWSCVGPPPPTQY